ncbi:MAG: Calx-beta domain-containing protein [Planctomycetota bacterium]|jgi:formylglycine-generating enzyme required for sulfatase activity
MTATTGTDVSGPVDYYFDETSGNPGATDSGWTTNPVYTDSGLDPVTQYTYTVQMRDSLLNTGTASGPASATTTDTAPPTPDPATFDSPPAAVSDTEITMTATTGSDASPPVEYFFDETSGNPGGTDSGWVTNPVYNDTGLTASTQYTYTVQMRDSLANTGTASAPANATTDPAPDTDPPTPDPATFDSPPAAVSDTEITMTATTGTDVSGPVEYFFDETSGNPGGTDSGWVTNPVYNDTGLTASTQYTYTVQMRDSLANTGTASAPANATTDPAPDTDPPTPDPATFDSPPAAVSDTEITMTATTGTDASPPVEYYFDETSGNPGGTDSGWVTNPVYNDTGLTASTQYTYTVQMRDSLANTGTASAPANATTDPAPDTDPPTPDPATFDSPPAAVSDTEITMTATTGSDASGPVEYYFDETSGNPGATDSGWVTNPVYNDTGLTASTQYTYTVQMRDSLANTGTASAPANATTDPAPDVTPPSPDPMTWSVVPYSTGTSSISMTAATATDTSGVEYYFECTAGGGNNSGWQDSTTYEDTGLSPSTQYTYRVQARDKSANQNATAWSGEASATTDSPPSLTLLVDAGVGTVQAGWVGMSACGTYTNVDGTGIDVTLATGNAGACQSRTPGGTGTLADVEADLLFADNEMTSPGSDFILTLSNLTDGVGYQLLSYHNRSDEGATTIPNVTVTGATNVTKPSSIVQDHPIMDNPAEILFTAGAGDVVIRYQGPDGGCPGCQAFFNGFELYAVTPANPTIAFASASSSDSETVTPALINVVVSNADPAQTYTVDYTVTGGTATGGGVDYTLANGTLTFVPGDASEDISIDVVDDGTPEADETIIITLSNATGLDAQLGTTTEHTYTILDSSPSVEFDQASSSGMEEVTPVSVTVSLSAPAAVTVTVDYAVTGGTATGGGVDYTSAPGTLTFNPNDVSEDITIDIISDGNDQEPAETIIIGLSSPTGASLGSTTEHTYTIVSQMIDIKVDFALVNCPDTSTLRPESAKPGWFHWSSEGWADMYMHDLRWEDGSMSKPTDSGIDGTGIHACITTGSEGQLGLHMKDLCRDNLGGGGCPYDSPSGDPIANTFLYAVDWAGPEMGDILLGLTDLPPGEYWLYSYHNHWEPCSQGSRNCLRCECGMPPMPTITANPMPASPPPQYNGWALPLGTGTGVTQIENAYDIWPTHYFLDSQLVPSLIKFETDGSMVLVIYEADNTLWPDCARPGREGSRAILNAFELVWMGPGGPDTSPPTPDPMTWETAPYATGSSSISMTATTATDTSGVEYYFECTSGGGNDSAWQDSTTYEDTGLSASTEYCYRVQARDKSTNQNATVWSSALCATTQTPPDIDPPTPDPATFASPPAAVSDTEITMTATTGSDASPPVEYYFDETSGNPGGSDSGWTANPVYTDSGLSGSTQYTYTVQMRDSLANTGTASAPANATTQADPTPPTIQFMYDASGDLETITPAYVEVVVGDADAGVTYTVDYAVTGGTATGGGVDYTLANGTLTFVPSDTSELISIDIVDDGTTEIDETIIITLSNPTGINAQLGTLTEHTYTIFDPDPSVEFDLQSSNGGEEVTPAYVDVVLSWQSAQTVTVDYTVTGGTATGGGVDYTLANGTLTFVPDDTSESISIDIVNDAEQESAETIVITLSNPVNALLGAYTEHTFTIIDDEMGDTYTNTIGMDFVRLDPGSFTMGSTNGHYDEEPEHSVTIGQSFYISKYEVTNAQYEQFDPNHGSINHEGFSHGASEAVIFVSWEDANAFCTWLSQQEGLDYRLPTEAEWEYACRAGTTTDFFTGGSLDSAYYNEQNQGPSDDPAPVPLTVGTALPNPWDLYDMHGNVEEWCYDWYGVYDSNGQTDPVGREKSIFRVTRGGSHGTYTEYLRSANRLGTIAIERNWFIGFRPVIAALPSTQPLPEVIEPYQQGVSQSIPPDINDGPDPNFAYIMRRQYVRIPGGSTGPLFSAHNHVPALVECDNGDLLAAWYTCESETPRKEHAVAISRLRYGAAEWDWASSFWEGPDRNDHTTTFWKDETGKIYHFQGLGASRWNTCVPVVRTSTDNGVTWSEPRLIADTHGSYGHVESAAFRNSLGDILVSYDLGGGTRVRASSDDGWTWTLRPGQILGNHGVFAEKDNGDLLAFSRKSGIGGKMPTQTSPDMGMTWTTAVASVFNEVGSGRRSVLLKLEEGPMFLATFGTLGGTMLIGALSYDDGATWPYMEKITDCSGDTVEGTDGSTFTMDCDTSESDGYCAGWQAKNGLIHLVTSRQHYAFNIAWLGGQPPAPDNDPPTPDPMTWATPPYATGSTTIAMVADTASDISGVEYYFECTAGGGNDSGWQDSTTYSDAGLSPSTQYTYRVQARDKSTNQNATAWSGEASATTTAAGGEQPVPPTSITATVSSVNYQLEGYYTCNENGLTGDLHTHFIGSNPAVPPPPGDGTMWLSTGIAGEWIEYEFDQVYTLTNMWVWNYNQDVDGLGDLRVDRGINSCTIEYSTDGVGWTELGSGHTFAIADGSNSYAHNTEIAFGNTDAKYVRITVISNHAGTHAGLSEVRFYAWMGPVDSNAPTPDPMTWATVPYSTGTTSISMTATTATDESGVEYYFECTAGGGHDSGWQDGTIYDDTALNPSTQYTYRVQARDKSTNQNATAWSTAESATTDTPPPDFNAPDPDPMTWQTVPYATGPYSISMTATTATDISGVEYYFECTAGGGNDSGWQDGTTYVDTGLSPITQYTYRVQARDKSPSQNATAFSTAESATTSEEAPALLKGAFHFRADSDGSARVGPHTDIMVRLGNGDDKLIFRRDQGYLPVWYTEAYGEEGLTEIVARSGCETTVNWYSRVRLIENNPARAIVHWRYAPDCGSLGVTAWVDEYFTVHPDGLCMRTVKNAAGTTFAQWEAAAPDIYSLQLLSDGTSSVPASWLDNPALSITSGTVQHYRQSDCVGRYARHDGW